MRTVYVDASVVITLAETGHFDLLETIRGKPTVPETVVGEVSDDPPASRLDAAVEAGEIAVADASGVSTLENAAGHLDADLDDYAGDTALLALALADDERVVVTDDKPLRKACKALGIPLSGSIGVLVVAVENGELSAESAIDSLVAMDEVGARMSASLFRKAERLIEEAEDEG